MLRIELKSRVAIVERYAADHNANRKQQTKNATALGFGARLTELSLHSKSLLMECREQSLILHDDPLAKNAAASRKNPAPSLPAPTRA